LRDISPRGARIAGAEVLGLPQTFELRIPDGVGGYSLEAIRRGGRLSSGPEGRPLD